MSQLRTQFPYITKKNLLHLRHILDKIYPTNIFNSSASLAKDRFNIKTLPYPYRTFLPDRQNGIMAVLSL